MFNTNIVSDRTERGKCTLEKAFRQLSQRNVHRLKFSKTCTATFTLLNCCFQFF